MPSFSHEALVLLLQRRPELAPELLRDVLRVELPAYTEIRVESADLTQVAPTEYRADLVVLLVNGQPVLGVVVEVQLARDERKKFTWPLYAAGLRARLECNTSDEAAREPELAVLSAVAHGNDEPGTAAQIAFAALRACLGLDDDHAVLLEC